jgi:ribosomal protein L37E
MNSSNEKISCQKCGTKAATEDAIYCYECGCQSTYYDILKKKGADDVKK